ncbi:negative regulator GrlR [Salmonella enterica subsp. enterica serovar Alachua]|nr:negative regulator GrlR [Salmonella enterica subsp. enterica serovar Alachua]
MKNGIYFVVFSSNENDFGNGTVVVQNGVVNGGDFGFTYQGKVDGDHLNLHVYQHDPRVTAVFHGVSDFNLALTVHEQPQGYTLSGSVVGMPSTQIAIRAKFIGELL